MKEKKYKNYWRYSFKAVMIGFVFIILTFKDMSYSTKDILFFIFGLCCFGYIVYILHGSIKKIGKNYTISYLWALFFFLLGIYILKETYNAFYLGDPYIMSHPNFPKDVMPLSYHLWLFLSIIMGGAMIFTVILGMYNNLLIKKKKK